MISLAELRALVQQVRLTSSVQMRRVCALCVFCSLGATLTPVHLQTYPALKQPTLHHTIDMGVKKPLDSEQAFVCTHSFVFTFSSHITWQLQFLSTSAVMQVNGGVATCAMFRINID